MARPLAYLECVLKTGHDWGPYERQLYENLLGLSYRVRWCRHCGKQDIASPW